MRLKIMLFILPIALASGATACTSSAEKRAASQDDDPQNTSSPQVIEKSNASGDTSINQSDGTKGGVATKPDGSKSKVKTPNGVRYRINAGQSQFTARVFIGGLFSAFGHNHTIAIRDLAGDVQLTPETIQPSSLRITMKANSAAEIGKEFSEKDRQKITRAVHEEALETAKYSEISFKSTQVSINKTGAGQYHANITGQLTLHGVTRTITIPTEVMLSGDILRARGEFPIRHSDYKIKQLSAGGGTVKAKDEMKLSFDIAANK